MSKFILLKGTKLSSSSAVLQDNSWLSRADCALLPLERIFALVSGLAVFSLMFLAAYSVITRKFFGSPMMGYVDLIESAMPIIAIMGVAYVQRDGTHIRMDMLVSKLSGRTLWLFELISVLMILLLMAALTWGRGITSCDHLIALALGAVKTARPIFTCHFGPPNLLCRLPFLSCACA